MTVDSSSFEFYCWYVFICVYVCVCVSVCVCVCIYVYVCVWGGGVCLHPLIVKASSVRNLICLGQLDQGTDQRYCVEDLSFLCIVPSLLL